MASIGLWDCIKVTILILILICLWKRIVKCIKKEKQQGGAMVGGDEEPPMEDFGAPEAQMEGLEEPESDAMFETLSKQPCKKKKVAKKTKKGKY